MNGLEHAWPGLADLRPPTPASGASGPPSAPVSRQPTPTEQSQALILACADASRCSLLVESISVADKREVQCCSWRGFEQSAALRP